MPLSSLRARALAPVSGASLAVFRFAFGSIVAWECWRYWSRDWIWAYYVEPYVRLTYWGWSWVPVAEYPVLVGVFVALAICGLTLAVGVQTRLAASLCALGLGYIFVLEQGRYLNHFYLLVLIAGLLALLPSGDAWGVDHRRASGRWRGAVPAWAVWSVRAVLGLVYTYAAVAKLNADWMRGEPIATWLYDDLASTPFAFVLAWESWGRLFAWGGLALDGLAVPVLLWRRTRAAAAVAVVGFHLFNAWAFSIGVFPWLMIAATPIFFEPDWPERLAERVGRAFGRSSEPSPLPAPARLAPRPLVAVLLTAFALYQAVMPLRHWLYPGDVAWTEEGHLYAWRMKLRTKRATNAWFEVHTDRGWWTARPEDLFTRWQERKAMVRPDLLLQVAHVLRDEALANGYNDVQVFARIEARLNDRPPQLLVDPSADLAAERRSLAPKPWVVPLAPDGDGPRLDDVAPRAPSVQARR